MRYTCLTRVTAAYPLLLAVPYSRALSSGGGGTTTMVNRNFRFVNFGESAPTDAVTISCDGRVRGATLELTHWDGNKGKEDTFGNSKNLLAKINEVTSETNCFREILTVIISIYKILDLFFHHQSHGSWIQSTGGGCFT